MQQQKLTVFYPLQPDRDEIKNMGVETLDKLVGNILSANFGPRTIDGNPFHMHASGEIGLNLKIIYGHAGRDAGWSIEDTVTIKKEEADAFKMHYGTTEEKNLVGNPVLVYLKGRKVVALSPYQE